MRLIPEIYSEAKRLADGMGHGFLKGLYSDESISGEFKEIKEGLELGGFALRYNESNKPKLMYAVRNAAGSRHADYTVFYEDRRLVCDLELTSLCDARRTLRTMKRFRLPGGDLEYAVLAKLWEIGTASAREIHCQGSGSPA
jgi:hypothetical protein